MCKGVFLSTEKVGVHRIHAGLCSRCHGLPFGLPLPLAAPVSLPAALLYALHTIGERSCILRLATFGIFAFLCFFTPGVSRDVLRRLLLRCSVLFPLGQLHAESLGVFLFCDTHVGLLSDFVAFGAKCAPVPPGQSEMFRWLAAILLVSAKSCYLPLRLLFVPLRRSSPV